VCHIETAVPLNLVKSGGTYAQGACATSRPLGASATYAIPGLCERGVHVRHTRPVRHSFAFFCFLLLVLFNRPGACSGAPSS
jgi:hypothetical protein